MKIEPRLRQIITPLYSILEDEAMKAQIVEFVKRKQEAMTDQRFSSFEGEVLQALLAVLVEVQEPSMAEIAKRYNTEFASEKYQIKAKKIGQVVEHIFHLQKHKTSTGIRLVNGEQNDRRLEELKIKYGIDKPSVDEVNVVNVPWEDLGTLGTLPTNPPKP